MLNDQQLQYLESYCVVNGVEYYDLQLEVIDHVAAVIEGIQQKDPSVDFKGALQLANNQFKKNDFRLIVKAKTHQLQKKVSRLIEKEFISFFTMQRIALTFLLYLSACLLANNFHGIMTKNKLTGVACIFFLASPLIYYLIRYRQQIKLLQYDREVNLLGLKIRSRYEIIAAWSVFLLNFLLNVVPIFFNVHYSKSGSFTFILVLFLVTLELLYIAILHVRFAFNDKMRNQYPGAFQQA